MVMFFNVLKLVSQNYENIYFDLNNFNHKLQNDLTNILIADYDF